MELFSSQLCYGEISSQSLDFFLFFLLGLGVADHKTLVVVEFSVSVCQLFNQSFAFRLICSEQVPSFLKFQILMSNFRGLAVNRRRLNINLELHFGIFLLKLLDFCPKLVSLVNWSLASSFNVFQLLRLDYMFTLEWCNLLLLLGNSGFMFRLASFQLTNFIISVDQLGCDRSILFICTS